MNQQPDKLFRDKLQSFSTPAPSGAWNRIEANLEKKNDKILWFRIAASLLLVAIAAWLLWPANKLNTPQPLADKTRKQETVTPEKKKEEQVPTPTPIQEKAMAKKQVVSPTRIKKRQPVKTEVEVQKVEAIDNETSISQNAITSVENNDKVKMPTITSPVDTQASVVASAETQKVKIIFSAEEIDNKYLDKKSLAEATSDEKKSSTLKKLFDKAYDLKHNQDPFGDLRQKKNEILALNFRTDKQRKEN